MKIFQRLQRISFGLACLLLIAGSVYGRSAVGQSNNSNAADDGYFTVYTYIYANSNNDIQAYVSDVEPDDPFAVSSYSVYAGPTWTLNGDNYSASGDGYAFTSSAVPPGYYEAVFSMSVVYDIDGAYDGDYSCESDDYDDPTCQGYDDPVGYVSLNVPYPPPMISSLSTYSVNQGDQGTLTVTGTNFINNASDQLRLNFSGSTNPFTLTSAPSPCTSSCTATFSYDFTGYTPGIYNLWLANNEAESEPIQFTVSQPPAPPRDLCSLNSNQAGFSSVVSSGISPGISGTFSVSFSGSEFAGINPMVTYGPYSTPESIAASMAALITRNYASYGLTAKAFGKNVIYSGTVTTTSGTGTIGAVSNTFSGNGGSSSFMADTSPAAADGARTACDDAPPPPPSSACAPDPGSRAQINVPARITLARSLLSPRCQNRLTVLPGYTTTKLFSTLNRALICQYPNNVPPGDPHGPFAYTDPASNTIDLLPNFYPPSEYDNDQAVTLIHEGIHLLGRGSLPDSTVQKDLGLPVDPGNTHNISDYIAGGCNP